MNVLNLVSIANINTKNNQAATSSLLANCPCDCSTCQRENMSVAATSGSMVGARS